MAAADAISNVQASLIPAPILSNCPRYQQTDCSLVAAQGTLAAVFTANGSRRSFSATKDANMVNSLANQSSQDLLIEDEKMVRIVKAVTEVFDFASDLVENCIMAVKRKGGLVNSETVINECFDALERLDIVNNFSVQNAQFNDTDVAAGSDLSETSLQPPELTSLPRLDQSSRDVPLQENSTLCSGSCCNAVSKTSPSLPRLPSVSASCIAGQNGRNDFHANVGEDTVDGSFCTTDIEPVPYLPHLGLSSLSASGIIEHYGRNDFHTNVEKDTVDGSFCTTDIKAVPSLPHLPSISASFLVIQSGLNDFHADAGEDTVDGHQSEGSVSNIGGKETSNNNVDISNFDISDNSPTFIEASSALLPHSPLSSKHILSSKVTQSTRSLVANDSFVNAHKNNVSSAGSVTLQSDGSSVTAPTNQLSIASEILHLSRHLEDVDNDGISIHDLNEIDSEFNTSPIDTKQDNPNRKSEVSLLQKKPGNVNICLQLIEREHALLKKSRKCTICSLNPRDITFLPCGHFVSCRSCAEPIFICPLCNKNIIATVDTFLS